MHARVSKRLWGRPVVLVHGLVVSSRYMRPTAELLARWFHVSAPDLPGFGRSEKPARSFDVPELADALAGWLDVHGLDRAAFLANSFGCQVVVDLAVRHPERVERAVLAGPTVDPAARSAYRQIARFLLEAPQQASTAPVIVSDFFQVVRGGRNRIVAQAWAECAARLLSDGRLAVVPGAGHALNWVAPLALAECATPFLLGRT